MAKNHYVDLAKIRNGPAQGPMVIAEHGPEKTGVNALMSQQSPQGTHHRARLEHFPIRLRHSPSSPAGLTLPAAMLLSGSLHFIFSRLL